MKKLFIIPIVLLMFSCTRNVQDEGILGTWIYTAEDAPFGFQKGKVVFYEENDSTKAKIKIYGFSLPAKNLVVDENNVSFSVWVETEEVSIKLEIQDDKMVGQVKASDLSSPIVLVKKGRKINTDSENKFIEKQFSKAQIDSIITSRKNILTEGAGNIHDVNYRVHTFYYGWFGNPKNNGAYRGWSGNVFPHTVDTTWDHAKPYPGGDDITSNFYPQLGCYSSIDTKVIEKHMQQIKAAGIGVIVLSWWGQKDYTDQSVSDILDISDKYGLKISFHIEPFYNTVEEFRKNIKYLAETYNQHPAIYKFEGKPMYYLYNSFKLKHNEWNSMLNAKSETTIRNTDMDGIFISLLTTKFDGEFAVESAFDGIYTYYASDGFSYGSTTKNWPAIAAFAQENNLINIPCVGPGYVDTRIRPWNEKSTRERDNGRYYETMFDKAVNTKPEFIGITSFNEWHEGTQIEPAVPKTIPSFTYKNFGEETDPYFYINKTKELISSIKTKN